MYYVLHPWGTILDPNYPSIYHFVHKDLQIALANMSVYHLKFDYINLVDKVKEILRGFNRLYKNYKIFAFSKLNKVGIMNLKLKKLC